MSGSGSFSLSGISNKFNSEIDQVTSSGIQHKTENVSDEHLDERFDPIPILSESWEQDITLDIGKHEHEFEINLNHLPNGVYCDYHKVSLGGEVDIIDYHSNSRWLAVLMSEKQNSHHMIRLYCLRCLTPHVQITWKCPSKYKIDFHLKIREDRLFVTSRMCSEGDGLYLSSIFETGPRLYYTFDLINGGYRIDSCDPEDSMPNMAQFFGYRLETTTKVEKSGIKTVQRRLSRSEKIFSSQKTWIKMCDILDESFSLLENPFFDSKYSFDHENVHYFVVEKKKDLSDWKSPNSKAKYSLFACRPGGIRFVDEYATNDSTAHFIYSQRQSMLYFVETMDKKKSDFAYLVIKLDLLTFKSTQHYLSKNLAVVNDSKITQTINMHRSTLTEHIKIQPNFCNQFFALLNAKDWDIHLSVYVDLDMGCIFEVNCPRVMTVSKRTRRFVEIGEKFMVVCVNKTIYTCSFDVKSRDRDLYRREILLDVKFSFH